MLPNAGADVCPNGDGDDPNAGVELACPNAGVDAAPKAGVLEPNVLVPNAGAEVCPNAGVEACPNAGVGVLGLPNAGFAPNGFAVEVDANGLGVAAAPKVVGVAAAPNGLDAAGVCSAG